jgi:putative GTP pyrophosphokinase
MSAEAEFIDRWRKEHPIYAAWGRFVGVTLSDAIRGRVAPTKLEMFLKLPVIPRIKEQDSILQKAFYRGKKYQNPYEEIEDKVGLRFVVLLTEDGSVWDVVGILSGIISDKLIIAYYAAISNC